MLGPPVVSIGRICGFKAGVFETAGISMGLTAFEFDDLHLAGIFEIAMKSSHPGLPFPRDIFLKNF